LAVSYSERSFEQAFHNPRGFTATPEAARMYDRFDRACGRFQRRKGAPSSFGSGAFH
jgi:hypothetical protein